MDLADQTDLVADRYQLCAEIGRGTFGVVYSGYDVETGGWVAVKTERAGAKQPLLRAERAAYWCLAGQPGIPSMHWFGDHRGDRAMVLDLLGRSLQKLRLSLEDVASLAIQLLYRVESVHGRRLLHRDIKPANIVTDRHGRGVYLIDFGFAKRYLDPTTRRHIRERKVDGFVGTSRYASANAHNSYEQSRRDDLESLGYVLVELCGGPLPWQQVPLKHRVDRHAYLARVKTDISTQRLCRKCPTPFAEAFRKYRSHVRGLGFQEKPNYRHLRNIWRPMMSGECRARCDVESMLADPLVPPTCIQ